MDDAVGWEAIGGSGLGAIDMDITARQIARTLNAMDCLVMGRSIVTSAEGNGGRWEMVADCYKRFAKFPHETASDSAIPPSQSQYAGAH